MECSKIQRLESCKVRRLEGWTVGKLEIFHPVQNKASEVCKPSKSVSSRQSTTAEGPSRPSGNDDDLRLVSGNDRSSCCSVPGAVGNPTTKL